MATVKAFIRTISKKEYVNVRFRLTDGRNLQLFHKSEIKVDPSHFDVKAEKIKTKVLFNPAKRKDFDKSISDRKNLIEEIYISETDKNKLSSVWLEQAIDKQLHQEKYINDDIKHPSTFIKYIAYFIDKAPLRRDKTTGRLLANNNIQKYKATEKHLINFAKQENKEDYLFSEINIDFYHRFVLYLQKLNFTQNTVGKQIRVLKTMLNDASDINIDMKDFKVFTEEVDNVYLNEEELQRIKDLDLSNSPHLDRVRDSFLILCWTGCRYSDLDKLNEDNIENGYFTFRQQKTNTKVTIPLHTVVDEIFKKYNYQMPEPITNQRFNEYIKDVAEIAEFNSKVAITRTVGGKLKTENIKKSKLISSHTGRRSFCTNMYKQGLPTIMIMSISGHKSEKNFLKYIKIRQDEHASMMAEAWAKIYKFN